MFVPIAGIQTIHSTWFKKNGVHVAKCSGERMKFKLGSLVEEYISELEDLLHGSAIRFNHRPVFISTVNWEADVAQTVKICF